MNSKIKINNFFVKMFMILIICFIPAIYSCGYGADNLFYEGNDVDKRITEIVPLSHFVENPSSLPDKYKILVLTDIHFGKEDFSGDYSAFFIWLDDFLTKKINERPLFCCILGDNVDHGYESEFKNYKDFVGNIEKRGIKVISILGNHDLFNSGWDNYKKYCYPHCSLFSFKTKNISWYGIDTGTGNVGKKQFELLSEAFENDKNPKIILQHYPLISSRRQGLFSFHDSTERNLLIDLYAKNNVTTVLCGHLHYVKIPKFNAFNEFVNPGFCCNENGWTLYEINENDGTVVKVE